MANDITLTVSSLHLVDPTLIPDSETQVSFTDSIKNVLHYRLILGSRIENCLNSKRTSS